VVTFDRRYSPSDGPAHVTALKLLGNRLLDQLGGIWEIIFWMTLPEPLPTEVKESF
jgi:hypothetical protein